MTKEALSRAQWPLTSQMRAQSYSIRNFARDVIGALDAHDGNMNAAIDEARPFVERMLRLPLEDICVKRQGNHTPRSHWVYFDYELEITLSHFPRGVAVPVHDHGTWEFLGVYRGDLSYTSYRQVPDQAGDGQAGLEVVEHRVLTPGDTVVTGLPPNDIHGFTPLSDDFLVMGMNHGPLAPSRRYFDVESNSVVTRDSKVWRHTTLGQDD